MVNCFSCRGKYRVSECILCWNVEEEEEERQREEKEKTVGGDNRQLPLIASRHKTQRRRRSITRAAAPFRCSFNSVEAYILLQVG